MRNELVNNGRSPQNEVMVSGSVSVVQMRMDQRTYPRLKNVPYETAIKELVKIVGNAFMFSGRNATEHDVAFIATNLYQELMSDEQNLGMMNISLAEIGRCVKKAIFGQGKEMFGISVASLYIIIADYCKGEGHMAEKQIEEMSKVRRMQELKASSVGALIDSYAGQMVKSNR